MSADSQTLQPSRKHFDKDACWIFGQRDDGLLSRGDNRRTALDDGYVVGGFFPSFTSIPIGFHNAVTPIRDRSSEFFFCHHLSEENLFKWMKIVKSAKAAVPDFTFWLEPLGDGAPLTPSEWTVRYAMPRKMSAVDVFALKDRLDPRARLFICDKVYRLDNEE